MDNYMPLETDEFIIVGIRHADYADRLAPWFEKGKPMEMANLKEITKTDVVYLTKSFYDHDPNTIGVFVSPEERLGYLWTNQAYAMKEWMKSHKVERVRIRITRISTKHGFMVAKALKPIKLTIRPRESLFTYMDWAKDIPMVRNCWMAEKLNRSILMLEDRLEECDTWSDELWAMTDGVIELLSYDLSTLCFIKGVRLYLSMKDSPIEEVREQSDRLLYTMIHRGSPEMMKWWTEHCLAYYIHEVKNDAGFLKVFECANYTLERVKVVLQQAPDHLFPIYLGKKERFASALYYAALPHEVYTRLLTLLAVYEAMIEKKNTTRVSCSNAVVSQNNDVLAVVAKCFKFTSDYVKEKTAMIVKQYCASQADLALIEITFYYHGLLYKRNPHKPFVKALVAWDILKAANDNEIELVTGCIKYKYNSLPKKGGYKDWGGRFLNDKETCINIGQELGDTMPYKNIQGE